MLDWEGVVGGVVGLPIAIFLSKMNLFLVFIIGFLAIPVISIFLLSFKYDFNYVVTRIIFELIGSPLFVLMAMVPPGLGLVVLALIGRHGKRSPSEK